MLVSILPSLSCIVKTLANVSSVNGIVYLPCVVINWLALCTLRYITLHMSCCVSSLNYSTCPNIAHSYLLYRWSDMSGFVITMCNNKDSILDMAPIIYITPACLPSCCNRGGRTHIVHTHISICMSYTYYLESVSSSITAYYSIQLCTIEHEIDVSGWHMTCKIKSNFIPTTVEVSHEEGNPHAHGNRMSDHT